MLNMGLNMKRIMLFATLLWQLGASAAPMYPEANFDASTTGGGSPWLFVMLAIFILVLFFGGKK
jgi:hypothetical protein